MKNTVFPFFALICTVWILGGAASPARAAQDGPLLFPPTKAQEIYFLFSKLAGRNPDIENMIKSLPGYGAAGIAKRNEYSKLIANMQADYATLDPKAEIIVIRTGVDVHVEMGKFRGLRAELPNSLMQKSAIYFPYSWNGTDIAVIPDMLEPFMDVPLGQKEAMDAATRTMGNRATMVLELRPVKADGRKPMELDGMNQWLLMTRLVGVTYYNQNLKEIWSWKDKNYRRSSRSDALLDLKK